MKKQDILQSYEKLNKRITDLQESLNRLDFASLFMQYGEIEIFTLHWL